jgi:hypothetical protein
MQRADVLERAKEAVSDRPSVYGSPEQNFERIARLWNAHVHNTVGPGADVSFTAGDVAILLGMVKIARLAADIKHADSWVDLAGYAACGGEVTGAGDVTIEARVLTGEAYVWPDWRMRTGPIAEGVTSYEAPKSPRERIVEVMQRYGINPAGLMTPETKFGFAVGETVNLDWADAGHLPGHVIGFADRDCVTVKWHHGPVSSFRPEDLRHGP